MIEKKDIEHLANLSRIKLDEKSLEGLTKDIESILGYVDQIKEVSATLDEKKEAGINRNVMREDENPHDSGINTIKILDEAPYKEHGFVKVKNIL
jgi:aspartyl-tRNA(Asn)/glutamyl-tRNA(Gln) amidotransferase subunit C